MCNFWSICDAKHWLSGQGATNLPPNIHQMSHLKSPRLRPQKRTCLIDFIFDNLKSTPLLPDQLWTLLMENFNIADTSLYTETLPSHPSIPVHTNPPRENENEMEFSNK